MSSIARVEHTSMHVFGHLCREDTCDCGDSVLVFAEALKNADMLAELGEYDSAIEYLSLAVGALNKTLSQIRLPYSKEAIEQSSENIGKIIVRYYPVEFIKELFLAFADGRKQHTSSTNHETLILLHSINKYINKLIKTLINNTET